MSPELDPNDPSLNPPAPILNTEVVPSSDNVDTSGRELFFQTIREKNAEISRLKAEAEERNKPALKRGEEGWSEFTNSPREMIKQEVQEAVKPLNDFISSLKVGNAFQGLKQQAIGINPLFAKVLEKAGNLVDQALSQANPTIENVVAALNLVLGMIASGQIKGLTFADLQGTPTPTNVPGPKLVPPTISPTPTPIAKASENGAKPWENLSETERAMARRYKMTDEQYYKGTLGDTIEVDPTKGGGKK